MAASVDGAWWSLTYLAHQRRGLGLADLTQDDGQRRGTLPLFLIAGIFAIGLI